MTGAIRQFHQREMELYQKGNWKTQLDYKVWFTEHSEEFTEVDLKLSEKISKQVQAEVKECYANTWKASWNRKYKYFEGFVWSKDIPIPLEHSWLVSKDNKVIDPTLIIDVKTAKKQLNRKYKGYNWTPSERKLGDEYVGVHIPTDKLNKFVLESKQTGGFLIQFYIQEKEK